MQAAAKALIEGGLDRVIIDSPAGIEDGFKTAASAAEGALVVINPEISSVRDADRIIGLLESREFKEIKLIVNRIRPDMVKKGDMLDISDVLDILGVDLIGIVPEDENVLVSTNTGNLLTLTDKSKNGAGVAFNNIARRIHGEEVPFLQLEANSGFLAGLRKIFGGN